MGWINNARSLSGLDVVDRPNPALGGLCSLTLVHPPGLRQSSLNLDMWVGSRSCGKQPGPGLDVQGGGGEGQGSSSLDMQGSRWSRRWGEGQVIPIWTYVRGGQSGPAPVWTHGVGQAEQPQSGCVGVGPSLDPPLLQSLG